jgi:hypothetical protein
MSRSRPALRCWETGPFQRQDCGGGWDAGDRQSVPYHDSDHGGDQRQRGWQGVDLVDHPRREARMRAEVLDQRPEWPAGSVARQDQRFVLEPDNAHLAAPRQRRAVQALIAKSA